MIRLLQRSTDFERVLKTRSRASSPHFAVHHLAGRPECRRVRASSGEGAPATELSTGLVATVRTIVDGSPSGAPAAPAVWLGAVVPKRHARRAVTRSLIKRQIRNAAADRTAGLADGLWVVRLRAPFDRAQFTSAASDALRRQARSELQSLLAAAAERLQRR